MPTMLVQAVFLADEHGVAIAAALLGLLGVYRAPPHAAEHAQGREQQAGRSIAA
jgi:hypothetical protein